MTDPELTLKIRSRTPDPIALTMRWQDLLFLHFPCDPEELRPHVPPQLDIDTFPDETGVERAWLGAVFFLMRAEKPRRLPNPWPNFPETNVRTYVHRSGSDPGVWFFSLDASNPFACAAARRLYRLNYREATMSVARSGNTVRYESRRWRSPHAVARASCEIGGSRGPAKPGTLEFFLIERYLLYSAKGDRLYKGLVHHPPYELSTVHEFDYSGSLVESNGLVMRPFVHALFSPGVDVVAGNIRRAI